MSERADETGESDGSVGSAGSSQTTVGALHRRARYTRWFRWHLAAALAVFFASAFGGYAVFGALPVESLADMVPNDTALPEFEFLPIMFNNLRALLLMFLGSVTGGLLSLFGLFVNGLIVGAVVGIVVQEASWVVILAALLPHGVVELSAFFMAAAIGLRVPHRTARYLTGYDETPLTRVEAFELVVLGLLMAVMIVVAAWVEVNVTPEVVRMVGGGEIL
jgi:stage II sporulation protein M